MYSLLNFLGIYSIQTIDISFKVFVLKKKSVLKKGGCGYPLSSVVGTFFCERKGAGFVKGEVRQDKGT